MDELELDATPENSTDEPIAQECEAEEPVPGKLQCFKLGALCGNL